MGEKLLVINADDFGFSDHTVEATIECFESGVLSSATLMANMPAFEKAASFAREHPEFSYGLHLCLTDEFPMSDPAVIPTLIAPNGRFWTTGTFFKRALTGQIAWRDVHKEVRAQLQRLEKAGVPVDHIDGHGHVHKAPVVLWALHHVLRESGITTIRRTQDLFYKHGRLPQRSYNGLMNVFIRRLARTTDHFLMVAGALSNGDTQWWRQCVERLPEGSTEIGIHPGWDDDWRRLDTQPVLEHGPQFLKEAHVLLVSFAQLAMIGVEHEAGTPCT
jgi:chitin disaccharide deacetylase